VESRIAEYLTIWFSVGQEGPACQAEFRRA
jgi:hypothetical protein